MNKTKHLHSITIDGIVISTRIQYNPNTNHIGIGNTFNYRKEYIKKYYNQTFYKGGLHSIRGSEEHRIKMSCSKQGIDRKDWNGFLKKVNYKRDYILPEKDCTKLNDRFPGSEGHHIMSGVVIYIPKDLHRNIYHNMRNGKGMNKINKLALDYLLN